MADLVRLLVEILFRARAKHKVEEILKAAIGDHSDLGIRRTGNRQLLTAAMEAAVAHRLLTVADLATAVDAVEENGAQHLFLFELTEKGKHDLTRERLKSAFQAMPAGPTEALYAEHPATRRTYFVERHGKLLVKQVYTAEYWELDETQSTETADRRTKIWNRTKRRAANLMTIHAATGSVVVAVDRVRDRMDDRLALSLLSEFATSLGEDVDLATHVRPVPVWRAFKGIIQAEDETLMTNDKASDASVTRALSSRRDANHATDIRRHPAFEMSRDHKRQALNVYWLIDHNGKPADAGVNAGANKRKIHTVLSRVLFKGQDFSKVYLAAKIEPPEMDHVLSRIRHFASQPS